MPRANTTTARILAFAIFGSAASGAAVAQSAQGTGATTESPTTGVAQMRELDDDRTDVTWNGVTLDALEDMDVRNAAGDMLGEVEDILGDDQDNVTAFVMEAGGFLGIGGEEVVVPVDRLKLDPDGKALVLDMSEEEVRGLPRWDD